MDNYKFYKKLQTATLDNLLFYWKSCLNEDKISAIKRVLKERKKEK